MAYQIKKDFIPGLPRIPYRKGASAYEGGVAHSTATPEATAAREVEYFKENWNKRKAFVHAFVDWNEIIQTADIDYKGWGAGKGNDRFFHVELCETRDPDKFLESYKRYVWLMAYWLKLKNLGVTSGGTLVSHAWVSQNLGGTDHMDPIDYLKSHGISWAQFVADVKAEYEGKKDGWSKENDAWYFYKDGQKETEWVQDKGKWYFLDSDGKMLTGWLQWKGEWYYLNPEPNKGEMLTGWLHLDWEGKKEWYFFHPDGKMARNEKVPASLGPSGALKP